MPVLIFMNEYTMQQTIMLLYGIGNRANPATDIVCFAKNSWDNWRNALQKIKFAFCCCLRIGYFGYHAGKCHRVLILGNRDRFDT
jgi:hypothetical protein